MKVEYGIPQLYMVKVNTDGTVTKQEVTVSSFDSVTGIVTVSADITGISTGGNVLFHEKNKNNYSFGKVTGLRTILLDEEAKIYFIAPAVTIELMIGMGVANFESSEIAISETGQKYTGQYLYARADNATDAEGTFTVTNAIFTVDFINFMANTKNINFGGGKALTIGDFDVSTDKEIRPNDLTLLAVKRRVEDDDLYEEFYMPRAKTGDIELPTKRDAYIASTYTFALNSKSSSDGTVFDYNVEI
jgi:hypothetical protein